MYWEWKRLADLKSQRVEKTSKITKSNSNPSPSHPLILALSGVSTCFWTNLLDFFQWQEGGTTENTTSTAGKLYTPKHPAFQEQRSGDIFTVLGKWASRTGESLHRTSLVLCFPSCQQVLLNPPMHSCSVQLNAFAKVAFIRENGKQGAYRHKMGNQSSWLLFAARSFSYFVTLKITTWPFSTKLSITNSTHYTLMSLRLAANYVKNTLGIF